MGTVVVVVVILYFVMAYIFNKETLADGSIKVTLHVMGRNSEREAIRKAKIKWEQKGYDIIEEFNGGLWRSSYIIVKKRGKNNKAQKKYAFNAKLPSQKKAQEAKASDTSSKKEIITPKVTISSSYTITENDGDDEIAYGSKDNLFAGNFYGMVSEYKNFTKLLQIEYEDAKGNITDRVIETQRFGDSSDGGAILAHCTLRDDNRTFKISRIIHCVDYETGEIITDILDYLYDEYRESPEGIKESEKRLRKREKAEAIKYYDEFIKKYKTLIAVLGFIVKADGTFNSKERVLVQEFFEDELNEYDESFDAKFLDKVFKNIKPCSSIVSFKVALHDVTQDENLANINLIELTENIIATQKYIHPNEKEIIDYLEKKFKVSGIEENIKVKIKISLQEDEPIKTISDKECLSVFSEKLVE